MDNQLAHYGILGMKWGVRRSQAQLERAKGNVDSTYRMVNEAKNINKAISNTRTVAANKNVSSISDEELRTRVNRLNMEQQYSNLTTAQTSRGQTYAKNTLEVAGSVLAIASSSLGIALAVKQLKK